MGAAPPVVPFCYALSERVCHRTFLRRLKVIVLPVMV